MLPGPCELVQPGVSQLSFICIEAGDSPQYSRSSPNASFSMPKPLRIVAWLLVTLLGALALATIALDRGEQINAMWLVIAALSSYALGYRFYSNFIAAKVLALDAHRATPAERMDDAEFERLNKQPFGYFVADVWAEARRARAEEARLDADIERSAESRNRLIDDYEAKLKKANEGDVQRVRDITKFATERDDANEECIVLRGILEKNDATIERLEKAIEDAPHGYGCSTRNPGLLGSLPCDCWKSKAALRSLRGEK